MDNSDAPKSALQKARRLPQLRIPAMERGSWLASTANLYCPTSRLSIADVRSVAIVLLAISCFALVTADGEAADARRYGLWGGQATLQLPKIVRVKRAGGNRYVLSAVGTKVEVTVDRGSIPSKYRGASTAKIARVARDRLRRQGHKIESFSVSGKAANIIFSGVKRQSVLTPRGDVQVEVPWRGRLRWLRQTNHRTYQSVVIVTDPERGKRMTTEMVRSARSLQIPPMRQTLRGRFKTAAGSVPLLTDKVGSWAPGWNVR